MSQIQVNWMKKSLLHILGKETPGNIPKAESHPSDPLPLTELHDVASVKLWCQAFLQYSAQCGIHSRPTASCAPATTNVHCLLRKSTTISYHLPDLSKKSSNNILKGSFWILTVSWIGSVQSAWQHCGCRTQNNDLCLTHTPLPPKWNILSLTPRT